jgi:predicted integral membrane protein DUF2269
MDLGTAPGWVVLVHALSGILFIAALIGRWIVLGVAERASTLPAMQATLRASGPFERLVRVVSSIVLVLGIAAAIAVGRPFLGPLQGGRVDWLFVALLLYLSSLPLIPTVFLPKGRLFEAAMADAEARGGEVTPELRAAWADPVTRVAHVYELVSVTLVLVLMLAKPF